MSHAEQVTFIGWSIGANHDLLDGASFLEVGSYDVNGSVRGVVERVHPGRYVGVDLVAGPGVDVVGFGHELAYPDGEFDVVLSGECFEHDPHWVATFSNMVRMTRPGGLVVFTCAAPGRVEHGTRRTVAANSPGTQSVGLDYYRNLTAGDFMAAVNLDEWFRDWAFHGCRTTFDLYFVGVRRGPSGMRLPDPGTVATLVSFMSVPHRLVRFPLRVMHRLAWDEREYQSWAVPYWNLLGAIRGAFVWTLRLPTR